MRAPAVAARDIVVRFGGVEALRGVTVDVGRGEVVGLIGPNGAGKTTLVNVIAGLRRPDAGSVELRGEDVTARPPHERAQRGLRRMFQYGGLVGDESVLMNLLIAHHAVPVDAFAHSRELLASLGLERDADRLVRDLPAGTARLVEFACVLAADPAVMLLDEPSAGLTPDETRLLTQTLQRHHAESDHGALVVAHHMRFVMELAHRVVVLADGSVIADGAPDRVQNDERVRALYLGGRT